MSGPQGEGGHRAHRGAGFATLITAALAVVLVAGTFRGSGAEADAAISIDAGKAIGISGMRLGTQFVWSGVLDRAPGTRPRFTALAAPLVRINVATDAPGLPLVMPAGVVQGDWNFRNLDSLVTDIHNAGGDVVLTIAVAPHWMWNCATQTIRDLGFTEFAAYMARVVAYYNQGSFVAEDGRTITNPAGIANRIIYWELWNEPDQPTGGCPQAANPNITAPQYVTMWNATVPKMLAVDPAIRLIGPTTGNAISGRDPEYLPVLMAGAVRKPDVVSFHGYGGWLNSQSDEALFDGDRGYGGIAEIERGLAQVQAWAPGIPIWVTELNVNSAWEEDDPAQRPWTACGVAWGASAFLHLALGGVDAAFQYQFAHPDLRQFSLVDSNTGDPLLPYWRDYYLARYFPPGSTLLSASSRLAQVEVLAARPPRSRNVHVLVVNRRVDDGAPAAGVGLPATVRIKLAGTHDVSGVTVRMLEASTPLQTGPAVVTLPADKTASVSFGGYGAALLEFALEPE